ncbi:MAG: hypothetical protein ACJ73S_26055 [Mycobacteriales bacterium]
MKRPPPDDRPGHEVTSSSDNPDLPERADRRGFLGFMGRAGMVAVGGLAGASALSRRSRAAATTDNKIVNPHTYAYACCHLARDNDCPSSGGSRVCDTSNGYHWQIWYCCAGSAPFQRYYACAECTQSNSGCYYGPFRCSAYWTVRANSCP